MNPDTRIVKADMGPYKEATTGALGIGGILQGGITIMLSTIVTKHTVAIIMYID